MRARAPHGRRRVLSILVLAVALAWSAGCGAPADLEERLEVGDVTTGWFDQGIVNGQNKLVPSVTFTLTNLSDRDISSMQLNVVFRRAGDADEWDAVYMRGIEPGGLAPGAATPPLVVRAKLGYTGDQPRADMMQHPQFVDAKVKIFAKHGSAQWVELGDFPIERRLLTQ